VGTAIGSVQVKVDRALIGTAAYGSNRPDVCAAYVGRPGCPNVGCSFPWNTTALSAAAHILAVTATDANGSADVGNGSVVVIKYAVGQTDYAATVPQRHSPGYWGWYSH
jgi:hypothetical protein